MLELLIDVLKQFGPYGVIVIVAAVLLMNSEFNFRYPRLSRTDVNVRRQKRK